MEQPVTRMIKYRWPIIVTLVILLALIGLLVWQARRQSPNNQPVSLDNNSIITQPIARPVDLKTSDDLDGDGLNNQAEQEFGSDPEITDTDTDGLNDWKEKSLGTDPTKTDTDGDGRSDSDEYQNLTNPIGSGDLDSDGDDLSDKQETGLGSNPYSADTNQDGINDGDALKQNISLTDSDLDKDGITNFEEGLRGTDPRKNDTDGDGVNDYQQIFGRPQPVSTKTDSGQ